MPQLLPYYFLNQITFVLISLGVTVYIMSRYILPAFIELNVSRMYITSL